MIRYFLLLVIACIGWYGSGALENRLYQWRTAAQANISTPAETALENMPMPADVSELQPVNEKLAEFGQTQLLTSISLFMRYQTLARILGLTPDSVATVGQTVSWANTHPASADALQRELLSTSLALELAAPDVAPPRAGRSGRNYNATFAPVGAGVWQELAADGKASPVTAHLLYFVLNVQNRLAATALQSFDFYPVVVDASEQPVALALPERSYFWCSHDDVMAGAKAALTAGNTMSLLCEVRGSGLTPLSPADVADILDNIRNGKLHFTAWTKQLQLALPDSQAFAGIQLRDDLVSAEFGHGPSTKTSAGFIAAPQPSNGSPKYSGRTTSCEERGDCLKKFLAPFEGTVSMARLMLNGTIPGILLAGLVQAIVRSSTSRNKILLMLAALTLLAFPIAFSQGGSGWGPLAILMLTAYIAAGFWIGIILGLACLKTIQRPE